MDSPKGADGFNYTRFYGAIAPVYGLGLALLPVWRHYTQSVLPWLPPGVGCWKSGRGRVCC